MPLVTGESRTNTDDKENNGLVVRFIDPAVLLELENVAITLRSVANFLETVNRCC